MEHPCKITVLETRMLPELQAQYLAGPCPCLRPGDTFLLQRNGERMRIARCNDGIRPVIFKIERTDIEES